MNESKPYIIHDTPDLDLGQILKIDGYTLNLKIIDEDIRSLDLKN